jgi:hypothetical protein
VPYRKKASTQLPGMMRQSTSRVGAGTRAQPPNGKLRKHVPRRFSSHAGWCEGFLTPMLDAINPEEISENRTIRAYPRAPALPGRNYVVGISIGRIWIIKAESCMRKNGRRLSIWVQLANPPPCARKQLARFAHYNCENDYVIAQ